MDLKELASRHKIIIAIDGFSSSGKSTMAKALAKRLGYRYIDSGAMYRAVTLFALRNDLINDTHELIRRLDDIHIDFKIVDDGSQHTFLNGEDVEKEIRGMEVSAFVSKVVSTIPEIRKAMVRLQHAFGVEKGIVMDGRDICTTVFPNAELKIFVDASAETRAKRRLAEMHANGETEVTYEEVLQNIKQRDYTDTHRAESPMHIAEGAFVLRNSDMSHDEQDKWLDETVFNCLSRFNDVQN